jgi:two-component sensor histidine kinase
VDQAVPFAVIVNELVTNALVHAFEPGRSGGVQVGLRRLPEERLELTVRDDGKGIAAEFIAPGRGKMGLNLVRALARQLGSTLDITCGSGTICRIVFRDDRTG